ncbi:hypothetical protein LY76DRAFT_592988 [Colletotrichum caudatum]|nr:hypothetical protein LY76DRAFT_592988 [Colletotrichum caudatum]
MDCETSSIICYAPPHGLTKRKSFPLPLCAITTQPKARPPATNSPAAPSPNGHPAHPPYQRLPGVHPGTPQNGLSVKACINQAHPRQLVHQRPSSVSNRRS